MQNNTRIAIDSRGNVLNSKRVGPSSTTVTPHGQLPSNILNSKRVPSGDENSIHIADNDGATVSFGHRTNGLKGFSGSPKSHVVDLDTDFHKNVPGGVILKSVRATGDADNFVPLTSLSSGRGTHAPEVVPQQQTSVRSLPSQSFGTQTDAADRVAESTSEYEAPACSGNPDVTGNHRWYHGRISREEAEDLLAPREDGLFLVRESTNFPGDYTLCVCFQGKVEHYRIISDHSPTSAAAAGVRPGSRKHNNNKSPPVRLTIDEEEYFDTLGMLVRHYTSDADGLCTNLRRALPRHDFQPPESSPTYAGGGGNDESDSGAKFLNVHAQAFKAAGWMIAPNELKLGESLGCGEFADVNLAVYQGQKVAVKTLKQQEPGSTQALLTEASLMTSMRHPNLVSLCGICITSDSRISLVTEYMSQGSLIEYLRSRGRHKLTKRDLLNFASMSDDLHCHSDTCAGMAYLESRQFVHRDLAARNVLLNNECTAKVADFGLARNLDLPNAAAAATAGNSTKSSTGEAAVAGSNKLPIKWTAPEALRRGEFSKKSDVWSFGILLWELFSFGRVPYPRIAVDQVERLVAEKGYRMEAPEECPDQIFETMKRCWNIEPAKRPTFAHMLCYIDDLRKELI